MTVDVRVGISGDASSYSRAVQEAMTRAKTAGDFAQTLNTEIDRQWAAMHALYTERAAAMTAEDQKATDARIANAARAGDALGKEYARAATEVEKSAKDLTSVMQKEDRSRVQSAEQSAGQIQRSLSQAMSGFAMGLGFAGGFTIFQQLGQMVRDSVVGWVELGHQVEHVSQLMGTSAENASVLIYGLERLGLSGDRASTLIAQLTRHMENSEGAFAALGIATRDANGHFISSYEVLTQLRQVMSGMSNDTERTMLMLNLASRSSQGMGQALGELQQLLSMTDAQWAAMTEEARQNNAVLTEAQAKMGYDTVNAARALQQDLAGLGRELGSLASGPIRWVVDGILDIIDTMRALGSVQGSFGEKVAAFFNVPVGGGGVLAQTRALVDQAKAARDAITAQEQGNQNPVIPTSGGGGGGGKDLVAEALQDRIAALRDAATAREQDLRDSIEAFRRERDAVIEMVRASSEARQAGYRATLDGLHEEQRVTADAFNERMANIRDELAARDQMRTEAIAGIRAQIDAEKEAFTAREAGRQADRDALNDQLKAIDQQSHEETRAAALQAAEDELAKLQAGEPNRVRSESLAQFEARHDAWVAQIAASEKKLADLQITQAKDVAKEQIQAKINVLDEATKADRATTDSAAKSGDDQIKVIEAEKTADRLRTDDLLKGLATQAAAAKRNYDERIAAVTAIAKKEQEAANDNVKALSDELKARTQTTDDAIKQLQRLTAAQVKELEQQLKDHQRTAGGIGLAYASIPDKTITITTNFVTNGGPSIPGGPSAPAGGGIPVYSHGPITNEADPKAHHGFTLWSDALADWLKTNVDITGFADWWNTPDPNALGYTPPTLTSNIAATRSFAGGGSMILGEPTALVCRRST